MVVAADLVYDRAKEIEVEVNRTLDSAAYKSKMRSLIFNLRDKNNPGLREAVVSGELSCTKLCSMGPAVSQYFFQSSVFSISIEINYSTDESFWVFVGYGKRGT